MLGGAFFESAGGKGANQAVAAARAGAEVSLIAALGNDAYGIHRREELKNEGINLRHLMTLPGINSGIALILIGGKDSQNLIGVARSANDRVSAAQVPWPENLARAVHAASLSVTRSGAQKSMPARQEVARG